MPLIQLTGLSGAGKTAIANSVKRWMAIHHKQLTVEIIDADEYRKTICKDLGFSKSDRIENIQRLGKAAMAFSANGSIAIIAAINPYAVARAELKKQYNAKTVWIKCPVAELIKRDTKGLYGRAMLAAGNTQKINNLTGINDPYEPPEGADLVINTDLEDLETSVLRLAHFILQQLAL